MAGDDSPSVPGSVTIRIKIMNRTERNQAAADITGYKKIGYGYPSSISAPRISFISRSWCGGIFELESMHVYGSE